MAGYKNPIPIIDDVEQDIKEKKYEVANDYAFQKSVYFAFIDVLGFKKNFDDNRNNKNNEFADVYRDVFNYYFELMNAASFMVNKESTGCYAGQTSDSLYFYTPRADLLIEFIKIFSHFSLYAMTKNIFFRGGIAKGKLFSKDSYQFYGDSVIYAYLLESVIARNPVVFIDENTYKEIKEYTDCDLLVYSNNYRNYVRPFVWLKEKLHLDLEISSSINIREVNQEDILKNIERNKKEFEYDAKNYEKYVFLLREFNSYMNKIQESK